MSRSVVRTLLTLALLTTATLTQAEELTYTRIYATALNCLADAGAKATFHLTFDTGQVRQMHNQCAPHGAALKAWRVLPDQLGNLVAITMHVRIDGADPTRHRDDQHYTAQATGPFLYQRFPGDVEALVSFADVEHKASALPTADELP